jgi:hypothetical protein
VGQWWPFEIKGLQQAKSGWAVLFSGAVQKKRKSGPL